LSRESPTHLFKAIALVNKSGLLFVLPLPQFGDDLLDEEEFLFPNGDNILHVLFVEFHCPLSFVQQIFKSSGLFSYGAVLLTIYEIVLILFHQCFVTLIF